MGQATAREFATGQQQAGLDFLSKPFAYSGIPNGGAMNAQAQCMRPCSINGIFE
jgi:hypothetical protein